MENFIFLSSEIPRKCSSELQRDVFRTKLNIYYVMLLPKLLMDFSCQLILQKSPKIDLWLGP